MVSIDSNIWVYLSLLKKKKKGREREWWHEYEMAETHGNHTVTITLRGGAETACWGKETK